MARFAGGILTILLLVLYAVEFCCAWLVLGIFSYFLARLADNNLRISGDWIAVEAISGIAAVLWTPAAFIVTLFFSSSAIFAIIAVSINLLLCACFVGLSIITRDGSNSCSGNVHTPLGYGPANSDNPAYGAKGFGFGPKTSNDYAPNLHDACILNRICFIVSIIAAFFFLASAIVHFFALRSTNYSSPHRTYSSASSTRRKRPKAAPLPSRTVSEKQPQPQPLPARIPRRDADTPVKLRTTLRSPRPEAQTRLSGRQEPLAAGSARAAAAAYPYPADGRAPQLPELQDMTAPIPATEVVPGARGGRMVHELQGDAERDVENGVEDNGTDNGSSYYQGTVSDDTVSNPYLSYRTGI